MTPTPEPGQRYILEAECVPSTAGHPMLTPITADGQPSAIRLAPTRYRWQPVPPQPPVLAVDSEVLLVDRRTTWRVATWDCIEDEDGQSAIVVLRPKYAPLADVPVPDDTTPAAKLLEEIFTGGSDEPPAGEGAALIAATEQETSGPGLAGLSRWELIAATWEATARRACAKLDELVQAIGVIRPWLVRHGYPAGDTQHLPQQAVDALEEQRGELEAARGAPVQATTHGEAGEAQRGVQGAAEQFNLDTVRCPDCGNEITGILNEGDSFPRHKSPTTSQGCPYPSTRALIVAEHFTRRRKPAVQGAGRDWRDILAVLQRDGAVTPASPIAVLHNPAVTAERIAEALGLHDLEQAAAEAKALRDQLAEAIALAARQDASVTESLGLITRLEAERDQLSNQLSARIDERDAADHAFREQARAAVDAAGKLDAARRELEQLRGDVSAIAHDCAARAAIPAGKAIPPDLWYTADRAQIAERLRAALAATAPATQDGGQQQ